MNKLFLLSLVITLAACAGKPLAPPTGLEAIEPGSTGVILPVILSPQGGATITAVCHLSLQRSGDSKKYLVDVTVADHPVFAAVPAGTYSFFDLNCGRNQNWDFSSKKWAPIFVIKPR